MPPLNSPPLNPAQFTPRACPKCGMKAHKLEVRGFLAQDRLAPSHFLLLNPLQFVVCVKCGNVVDPKDFENTNGQDQEIGGPGVGA